MWAERKYTKKFTHKIDMKDIGMRKNLEKTACMIFMKIVVHLISVTFEFDVLVV